MPRIAYVNGVYKNITQASINIEDRGFQFADGVYEVCLVVDCGWWDLDGHIKRFWRSLEALGINRPVEETSLRCILSKLVRMNRTKNALVYLQATRGAAPRNHPFPDGIVPSFVATARPFDFNAVDARARKGVSIITQPDIRWGRVDIKSISLLPNILAKQAAREKDSIEAMLHKGGLVTEGASSNMWIIGQNDNLITHPLGREILAGITRETTIECARTLQLNVEERAFTVEEALNAKEVFLTSATNLITPVTRIDGKKIKNGAPGHLSLRLRDAYIDRNRNDAKIL